MTEADLRIAVEGIKLPQEVGGDTTIFRLARGQIAQAERLYFIGFGYHETNLQRLGLPRLFRIKKDRDVYGSAMGLTDEEARAVQDRICDDEFRKGRICIDNKNGEAFDFVRQYAVFG